MPVSGRYPFGILKSVVPSGGGWRFPYPEEHAKALPDQFIRASSFDALVAKVRMFRIESAARMGDVEHEVATYIRGISPQNDRHPGKTFDSRPEGHESYRPPIERGKEWLLAISRQQIRTVLLADAFARADVCVACPHNVKWRTDCEPCNEDVDFRLKNLRRRPIFNRDPLLGFCRLHGVMLASATFFDIDHLPPRHADAPPACWMPAPKVP